MEFFSIVYKNDYNEFISEVKNLGNEEIVKLIENKISNNELNSIHKYKYIFYLLNYDINYLYNSKILTNLIEANLLCNLDSEIIYLFIKIKRHDYEFKPNILINSLWVINSIELVNEIIWKFFDNNYEFKKYFNFDNISLIKEMRYYKESYKSEIKLSNNSIISNKLLSELSVVNNYILKKTCLNEFIITTFHNKLLRKHNLFIFLDEIDYPILKKCYLKHLNLARNYFNINFWCLLINLSYYEKNIEIKIDIYNLILFLLNKDIECSLKNKIIYNFFIENYNEGLDSICINEENYKFNFNSKLENILNKKSIFNPLLILERDYNWNFSIKQLKKIFKFLNKYEYILKLLLFKNDIEKFEELKKYNVI